MRVAHERQELRGSALVPVVAQGPPGDVVVHGLAGAVGFYGRPGEGRDGSPGPTQRAGEIEAPILALQAGADQNITAEDNAEFEAALEDAGVEHELVTYPGAPHSFFDRKQEEFADASDDAWGRVLAFTERHAAG